VEILEAFYFTQDLKCFVTRKPIGCDFIPDQTINVSINLPKGKDKLCPFTCTDYLFIGFKKAKVFKIRKPSKIKCGRL
jgi:hypothetical protein